MEGRLTFLGTGTSMGVPTLGCWCAVCTSADPHDRRLRPSVLIRGHEGDAAGRGGGELSPLYGPERAAEVLQRIYDYTFSPDATYPNRARVQIEPMGARMNV